MGNKSIIVILFITSFFSCKKEEEVLFFENFSGTSLNTSIWNYELGDGCPNLCGWGNNERQVYTKENVQVKDGSLIITATKDSTSYFSGRITTKNKFEFQYGTIEAKMKLPEGSGLWPAFWMLGSNISEVGWPKSGEIDIMEYVGKKPHEIHTTLHTQDSYGQSKNTKISTIETIEEGFHTYKAKWTEESITFYIDDNEVYVFNPKVKDENTWPFNQPFYILVNMAIGGNFGGPEVDDNIFPKQFEIDYIKVVKN
ncbi:MAG: laminarinase [Flavobacteriaceae bacterium]|uniref:glycoside hydrolase family 16 protein n=1 Tax=Winogradskyella sp. SYSU M77433 TaxID=3042722 RepID=UPI000C68D0F1|nr:glycoside hydrolase family 16 protein [Winogradskyella sp. SYSU M77433]MAX71210.1 laminarinase [Flavobacteriaceae bacterium]MDH7911656.1 glycoside hydrolase family 16 protein [Winogradskyella sp. SYSU M77433]|tara:strand:- start:5577 stop:6341 length:765 start_codon:yes stop_codon:yes gene_type:complete